MDNGVIYENQYFQFSIENSIVSVKNIKGGAAILPLTSENKVLLLNVYRKNIGKFTLEIPRGFIEHNETAFETAEREMMEEISCKSEKVVSLGELDVDSGLLNSRVKLFLGLNTLILREKVQTEENVKELKIYNYKDVFEMIIKGEINDSFTIAAFTRSFKYIDYKSLL